jgi:hypothetical protein
MQHCLVRTSELEKRPAFSGERAVRTDDVVHPERAIPRESSALYRG